ncbi:MAG: amino acid kinase family protein [Candidatus Micrarchaeaceae archaeon]
MRYVIALGGNAIADSSKIGKVAKAIARLYAKGDEVVVTHGNGPQVGELSDIEDLRLPVLTAQTEAWIGTEIRNKIAIALNKATGRFSYAIPTVVLTDVIVESGSKAFSNPTKPIGRFMEREEAEALRRKGFVMHKLIHGYRRVVPSPNPKEIIQAGLIEKLLKDKRIVIACGGGGISMRPVSGGLEYADAVIDKDLTSALLAKEIKADRFLILTDVDGVYLDFNGKSQRLLRKTSATELKKYIKAGYFEEGSMKPKVESCIYFADSTKRNAGIGNISRPEDAIAMRNITIITP